jgi:ABC-2 type transport system permease protein
MKSFFALLNAGFREFTRDRTALFFTLAFPLMFLLLFGLFFGQENDISAYSVSVVLEDPSDQAAVAFFCLSEMIDQEDNDRADRAISAEDVQLCAQWLEQAQLTGLSRETEPPSAEIPILPLRVDRSSREEALENLRNADRRAVIIFPKGFGEQIEQRKSGRSTAVTAKVEVHYDASQTTSAQVVQQIISGLLDEYDRQLRGASRLITTDFITITAEEVSNMDFFVPGVIAMSLMQGGVFGALVIVSWRERKILKRLGATPLPRRTLVSSQVSLRLIIAIVQTYIILAVGAIVFDVTVANQPLLMLAFILLGSLTFIGMGYLVASFAVTEAAATAIVQVIQFPMMFLSGIFWPIEFAPEWLQPIIYAMPLTYLGDALRQVMVEGSSALFPLWLDATVLAAWLVISLLIAFRFFRWE